MTTPCQYFERDDLWNSFVAMYGPFHILWLQLSLGSGDVVEISLKCDNKCIGFDDDILGYRNIM